MIDIPDGMEEDDDELTTKQSVFRCQFGGRDRTQRRSIGESLPRGGEHRRPTHVNRRPDELQVSYFPLPKSMPIPVPLF